MIGADDQRNYLRMLINSEVELDIEDAEGGQTLSAMCRDLSATGMAFEVEQPIEIGSMIRTRINTNNSELSSLQAHAKVVRCVQETDNLYLIGAEVIEIN